MSSVVRLTWMAAGKRVTISWSERGRGADLTRQLCTSRAMPFSPFLSSEALRMETCNKTSFMSTVHMYCTLVTRVGTSLFWRAAVQPGLEASTLKMSWLRLVITGSLLYFRNMAMARGDTL